MAVACDESYPFQSSQIATEDQYRALFQYFRADGVHPVPTSSIPVTASMAVSPNTGLTLNVATGACTILGTIGRNTSTKTVTLSANSSGNPRVDVVVARLNAGSDRVEHDVLTGTPAATPIPTALTQTTGTWEIPLAYVTVASGAASITADNIVDRRNIWPGLVGSAETNPVRNPSGKVAQRGTSVAVGSGGTTLDCWRGIRSGAVSGETVSQQAVSDWVGDSTAIRCVRDNGNTSTAQTYLQQAIPTSKSKKYVSRLVCLSFRARKLANFSAASNALSVSLVSGTGTDEPYPSAFTGAATVASGTATLTANFQTFIFVGTPGATATQLGLVSSFIPVGTAGALDGFEIKDVRIDEGDRPLPPVSRDYDAELANCRFYFRRDVGSSIWLGSGVVTSATTAFIVLPPQTFRATPTISIVGAAGNMSLTDVGVSIALTSSPTANAFNNEATQALDCTSTTGGMTTGRVARLFTSAGVGFDRDAEI